MPEFQQSALVERVHKSAYHAKMPSRKDVSINAKIVLSGGKSVVTRFQLGELEAFLNDLNLLRIHRPYLVAKDKIEAFTATEVEVGGVKLAIGRSYQGMVGEVLLALSRLPK